MSDAPITRLSLLLRMKDAEDRDVMARNQMGFESFPREERFRGLDSALPEVFERRPDARGALRFDDIPVRGQLYLVTKGDGLAEAQWRNDKDSFAGQSIKLTIERECILSGRVTLPDGSPSAGMEVSARRTSGAYLSTKRAVTDQTGKFLIRGLPETEFVFSMEDPKKLWTFRPIEDLHTVVGNPRNLTLGMERGVLVSGRVLDQDGQPVEGAAFSAISDNRSNAGLSHDSTDGNGNYQFRRPFDGRRDGLAASTVQSIIRVVDRLQPEAKELILFRISSTAAGTESADAFANPNSQSGGMVLARRLGFGEARVSHSPQGGSPENLIGKQPPPFTLNDLSGEPISIAEHIRNRAALITFWGLACGPCRLEAPHLSAAFQEYSDRGFSVVAVNAYDDAENAVAEYVKEQLRHPIGLNGSQVAREKYGVGAYPTSFWVDRQGKIVDYVIGCDPGDEIQIVKRIEQLLD